MIDVFYLIDTRGYPSREKTTTIARKIGDRFLSKYLRTDSIYYCGYTVEQGQFAPFWRLAAVPKSLVNDLHKLTESGYIGKVKRCFNSY